MDKNQYIDELEQRISRAQVVLDELKLERETQLRTLQHQEIERLEQHLASTEHKLEDLREAGAEAWPQMRDRIEHWWSEVADWIHERLNAGR